MMFLPSLFRSSPDLNGDVLHSLIGLPSTLRVSKAHVAVLQIHVCCRYGHIHALIFDPLLSVTPQPFMLLPYALSLSRSVCSVSMHSALRFT